MRIKIKSGTVALTALTCILFFILSVASAHALPIAISNNGSRHAKSITGITQEAKPIGGGISVLLLVGLSLGIRRVMILRNSTKDIT